MRSSVRLSLLLLTLVSSVFVVAVTPRFAYVPNYEDGTVSMYTVDPSTGQLRANGYVLCGGVQRLNTRAITVVLNKFVYVVNEQHNSMFPSPVWGYSINKDGTLRKIGGFGAWIPGAGLAFEIAADPKGRFVYVPTWTSDTLLAFRVDATTGQLTSVPGSPIAVGSNPRAVTVDPSGRFVFVANTGSDSVAAFTIHADTGALAPVAGSPFKVGDRPYALSVHPNGQFLIVANSASSDLSIFKINQTTAALTSIGSPVLVGSNPRSIVFDLTGKFLYVANVNSRNISVFSFNATTGLVEEISGSPFATPTGPRSLAVDATNRYLYVAFPGQREIAAYRIGSTGALAVLPRTRIRTRGSGYDIALASGEQPVTYRSKFLHAVSRTSEGSGLVSQFAIASDGSLTQTAPPKTTSEVASTAMDPFGRFLYVGMSTKLLGYVVNGTTGVLSQVTGSPFGNFSFLGALAFEPTGRFLYAADGSSTVVALKLDRTTGALTRIGSWPSGGTGPSAIVADPSGKFLIIANSAGPPGTPSVLQTFTIDPSTGALTPVSSTQADWNVLRLVMHPSGRFLYVASQEKFSRYSLNAFTGELRQSVSSFDEFDQLAVVPSGRFLYGSKQGITGYTVSPDTGGLTRISGSPFEPGQSVVTITADFSGKFVYGGILFGTLSADMVNQSTGSLSPIAGSPFPLAEGACCELEPISIFTTGSIR